MYEPGKPFRINDRFRGYLPVVVDLETGGFNEKTDALLEIAAVLIRVEDDNKLVTSTAVTTHVTPFDGANIEEESLQILSLIHI